jgi:hypothetical protein
MYIVTSEDRKWSSLDSSVVRQHRLYKYSILRRIGLPEKIHHPGKQNLRPDRKIQGLLLPTDGN